MTTTLEATALEATATATTAEDYDEVMVLRHVSWATYESLMKDYAGYTNPHFTYDEGVLEIVSPSSKHERLKDDVVMLINAVAEELEIDSASFGSTTIRRQEFARGFEPDACFYFQNVDVVRGKDELDFTTDPPPDLVIEIDLFHSSLDKLSIFAAFGVLEVWRFDNQRLTIYALENHRYTEQSASRTLPVLTIEAITDFINQSRTQTRLAWLRRIREWTHEQRQQNQPLTSNL